MPRCHAVLQATLRALWYFSLYHLACHTLRHTSCQAVLVPPPPALEAQSHGISRTALPCARASAASQPGCTLGRASCPPPPTREAQAVTWKKPRRAVLSSCFCSQPVMQWLMAVSTSCIEASTSAVISSCSDLTLASTSPRNTWSWGTWRGK